MTCNNQNLYKILEDITDAINSLYYTRVVATGKDYGGERRRGIMIYFVSQKQCTYTLNLI